jgi:diguanylate cyclase
VSSFDVTGSRPALKTSRTFVLVHFVSYVGISAHAAFIGMFWWLGVPKLALFNVGSVVVWVLGRIINQRHHTTLAAVMLATEVMAHAVLAVSLLGWSSGFHYYLIPLIPFMMFNDQLQTRTVVASSVMIAAVYLILRFTSADVVPPPTWDSRAFFVEYMNIVVPLTALAIISIYFRFASVDFERAMESLAMTDPLTKAPNRRRMRELLNAERIRFQRGMRPFIVIIGDVDDFKVINDTRGHDCGDHVLVEVAAALRAVLRAQDAIARWGGEEFLFLLPDTDLRGGGIAAEKMRNAIQQTNIAFAGDRLGITMTFGVAVYDGKTSLEACVRRADEALYAGKHRGKNQVVVEQAA